MPTRVFSFVCVLSVLIATVTPVLAWDYIDDSTWGAEFPMCMGNMQSPVHLHALESKAIRSTSLVFSPGCNFLPTQNFTVVHLNYTYAVNFNSSLDCTVSYTNTPPATLARVEFLMGSEHAIEDMYYGMESQWTFYRPNGAMVRVSIMLGANFVAIPETAPGVFATTIMDNLPHPQTNVSGDFNLRTTANFTEWATGKSFFTYMGSITIPPCTEGVEWIVIREAVAIPRIVHLRFANAMRMEIPNFDNIGGNARELRPLNGREVVYHVTSKVVDLAVVAAKKSRNSHIVIISMIICVGMVILALWGGSKVDAAVEKKALEELAKKEMPHV